MGRERSDGVCVRLEKQREGRSSQTRKKQHCPLESRASLCSDDDWRSKCPSGCRLHGALWQLENKMDKNLRALCKTAMDHEKTALKSMTLVTDIYKKNRKILVKRHMSELNFVEQAQRLSRNLISLQKYSSRMSQKLEAVHHQVLQQLEELYRTEVDISIKLQACAGSCHLASPLSINHEGYQDSMEHLDKAFSNRLTAEAQPQQVPWLKLLPADLGLVSSAEYKTIPLVQTELLTEFEDIEPNQIILEDSMK